MRESRAIREIMTQITRARLSTPRDVVNVGDDVVHTVPIGHHALSHAVLWLAVIMQSM